MLTNQRNRIDEIDKQIIELIEERLQVVEEVAKIKKENNMPVLDSSREKKLLNKMRSYTSDDELKDLYEEIFKLIMAHSKSRQQNLISK